jgi:N-acetylmuramoyl-L-alanine amidase
MILPHLPYEDQLKDFKSTLPEWVFYNSKHFSQPESIKQEDDDLLFLDEYPQEPCPVSVHLEELIILIREFDFSQRKITKIIHHCTATSSSTSPGSITRFWREKLGWKNPGYHILIDRDGYYTLLQPFNLPSNGVRGHNQNSIHISYIGGINSEGKGVDTRTPEQEIAIGIISEEFKKVLPKATFHGHREFSNKLCPCYDIKKEYPQLFQK